MPDMAGELHEVHDKEAAQNQILQRTDQFKSVVFLVTQIQNLEIESTFDLSLTK